MIRKILTCTLMLLALSVFESCSKTIVPEKGKEIPESLSDGYVMRLYEGSAPGSEAPEFEEATFGNKENSTTINVSDPTLTVYLPEKPNGTSMVVCPGGGFLGLGMISEGEQPARRLNEHGITVFVLKYRLSPLMKDNGKAPGNIIEMGLTMLKRMEEASDRYSAAHDGASPNVTQICSQLPEMENAFVDADKAIEVIRQNAERWGLDKDKIGIMGFSAGGITSVHQAMTHSAMGRPNFVAAVYGGWTDDIAAPEDACPLWMCSPVNDLLWPEESNDVYRAWRGAKVPTELHTFWSSEHGYAVKETNKNVDHWVDMMIHFMKDVEFLNI